MDLRTCSVTCSSESRRLRSDSRYVIRHVTTQDSMVVVISERAFEQLLQVRSHRFKKVEQAPFVSLFWQYESAPAEPGSCTPGFPVFMHGETGGWGAIGGAGGMGGMDRVKRSPQSVQSYPKRQAENVEPVPPSSHSPSDAWKQLS